MALRVVGAGVGRTGTNSLKLAFEQLLDAPCHHMFEVMEHPEQIPTWTDAIEGRAVDWAAFLSEYRAQVDWPGASFWPELSAANPDALVLLSVRDPESWWKSASDTIFVTLKQDHEPGTWLHAVKKLFHDRFCDSFDDHDAMIDAYHRHNDAVRNAIPASRLLEWTASEGWAPLCERLGVPVPDVPFPWVNTTAEMHARRAAREQQSKDA
jgi:uncharacterized protein YndB with AHSA1/START domain